MRALSGSWGALAAEYGSSHLVEKCFDIAVRCAADLVWHCLFALYKLSVLFIT